MPINYESAIPVWRQIAEIVRERINSGLLAPGMPVPSEKQLQDELGVARHTVRKAIAALRAEGLVVTVMGKGSYVMVDRSTDGHTPDPS